VIDGVWTKEHSHHTNQSCIGHAGLFKNKDQNWAWASRRQNHSRLRQPESIERQPCFSESLPHYFEYRGFRVSSVEKLDCQRPRSLLSIADIAEIMKVMVTGS